MTPTKHPLSWFIERIGKTVECTDKVGKYNIDIADSNVANQLYSSHQNKFDNTFRDPHPLTSSILTCSVISCDTCGKIGTTEDLDKEVAAKGFEGEGWKRMEDGTINCGCKK